MKKAITLSTIFLMVLFGLSSFNVSDPEKKDNNRGSQGSPIVFDFYNFDLSGSYGCSYYLEVTVNFTKGFGIRQATHNNTMDPNNSWHLVINRDKDEVVVSQNVRIVGSGIDETFPLNSTPQWFPNQSCHSPFNGSGTLGTNWIPWSNNYYEFGEDLFYSGSFLSQSK